ncbi:DUF4433 domain-containing protein [Bacillus licheniformis]|uniref:DarT ssDNA thymidine ADP-ribosyltransferase family protein n=1 Tax=Bacillus licheniformis TaxID=1402 RepID=UPI000BE2715D|nr:DarT ssDNA thymidine ADP-ribosyltransferase family protein [Bacillus licheniformis]ATI77072.1 hypothetical protein CPQ91_14920 [Bacillus licheniformis]MCA1181211.1 DUF4433 domain-containing protein [Bacillus licheniformis]MCY7739695.1 DUF4433 domain-containing protein [Bacillus licheniformis]MEC2365147.1 DarT ssDNA thymidine ADP-ribosyltransferase family protein [Bacillus licheniformis]MEC3538058.1 DarT ssDNA thymidine ADP-ribosyltransferase family protein [Bacillus licheniformis]
MNQQRMKNSEQFEIIINDLVNGKINTGLPPQKRWIPKYVYHFTDLINAKNILTSGYIYSRSLAKQLEIMEKDNASQEIIDHTEEKWKSYARFYFRPKTPTQYHNEGIRCSHQINQVLKAHCPVPIFFLFDSLSMLTMEESKFTYGNLAAEGTITYEDAKDFKNMPFSSVYHEGYFDRENEHYIVYNRHAELIVPRKASLQYLRRIVCRSNAEKETLINLLDSEVKEKYKGMIIVDTRNAFFNGCYTFVEEANLTSDKIIFTFNQSKEEVLFNAKLRIYEVSTGLEYKWKNEKYPTHQSLEFDLSTMRDSDSYSVEFFLDEHLAYRGVYVKKDSLPF